jgi:uncharacterized protein YcbX
MDFFGVSSPLAVVVSAMALLGSLLLFVGFFKSRSLPPHDEIVGLRIYPIKSCHGIPIKSARLFKTGLDLDRNWMFISEQDREFVTIRSNSQMTLIRTQVDFEQDVLTITIEGNQKWKLSIPAHPTRAWLEENTELRRGVIWGQETDGWEYPASLTQPISDFLGMSVRLLYKGPTPRVLRGCGAPDKLGRTEATKFADMMPVLVSSLASIAELNKRLQDQGEEAIDIERFRPNIILKGHKPWSEDNWKSVRISSKAGEKAIDMDVVCRCLRCQVPNVDPESAEKNPRQPWNELVKYRRIDEGLKFKPSFGMLCVPKEEGTVAVGMQFSVTKTTEDHFFISPMK